MQIFSNIPTLFEYFLDVLQQRVEILEKDDISVFLESSDSSHNDERTNNEVKRETDQCLAINETPLNDQGIKNIDKITDNNAKSYQSSFKYGNKYKRQNRLDAVDDIYTTEIHEFGQAGQLSKAYKKNFDDSKESAKDITAREIIKNDFIDKPLLKHLPNLNKLDEKSITNKKLKSRPRRNDPKLGNEFAGIYWSLFYLSPEEVEEKTIRTEQIIEDHKKKNRKK